MSYIRRDRKEYIPKPVSGDRIVLDPAVKKAEVEVPLLQVESLYDDEVRLALLEAAERDLQELEDLVKKNMSDLVILLDPDQSQLVQAVSVLQGEPSLVLDGQTIEMALDLSMDGFLHGAGFDPVSAILGFDGAEDDMPLAPIPTLFQDCQAMAELEGTPSPGDSNYQTKKIDDINLEVKGANALEILAKLWRILKYFPGLDLQTMLRKVRKWPIKGKIDSAIKWIQCNMVNPGWFLLTGEPKSCSEEEAADDPPEVGDDFNLGDVFEGKGMDCLEAAAIVMTHVDTSHRSNNELKTMFNTKEQRAEHEALKFGTLCNSIRNTDNFEDRIENLYESTKNIPRYKKRFYDHRDAFLGEAGKRRFKLKSKAEYEQYQQESSGYTTETSTSTSTATASYTGSETGESGDGTGESGGGY
jgi:hypothetical protein